MLSTQEAVLEYAAGLVEDQLEKLKTVMQDRNREWDEYDVERLFRRVLDETGRKRDNKSRTQRSIKKGSVIGQGGFGEVTLGLDTDTGEQVAIKTIKFNRKDRAVTAQLASLQNEISLMKSLSHSNIVRYYYSEAVSSQINIIMEYVAGGSILGLLKQFGQLSVTTTRSFTRQILSGLSYLHQNNVIHRDVKCANILLTVTGECKLADFGCSGRICALRPRRKSLQGTPLWMAPEVITQQPYDHLVDIWSLGCTIMEMLTGEHPFHFVSNNHLTVMRVILDDDDEVPLPQGIEDPGVVSFLRCCLVREPSQRWTSEELSKHPWIGTPESGLDGVNLLQTAFQCWKSFAKCKTVGASSSDFLVYLAARASVVGVDSIASSGSSGSFVQCSSSDAMTASEHRAS
eukprot:TRINITY_DN37789_c0_g1_i1.p1 TRINITY_DN37789_c0_g1~~TRINITY_DN37789_c0_g1_i1.p1  ORF type:complete len:402 (+),score=32.73 TRINITY_DN37789_c0_g1_i1:45-1250(+)